MKKLGQLGSISESNDSKILLTSIKLLIKENFRRKLELLMSMLDAMHAR